MKHIITTTLLSLGLAACGSESTTTKGSEDNALTNLKDDSFFSPTEHGQLSFGVDYEATFSDESRFHAWDISLAKEATLTIETDSISGSVDTVMYLYKQEIRQQGYLYKNDDAKPGVLLSKIQETFEPGDYRIIVKGHKEAVRGEFSVRATCAGEGCEHAPSKPTGFETIDELTGPCLAQMLSMDEAYALEGYAGEVTLVKQDGRMSISNLSELSVLENMGWQAYQAILSDRGLDIEDIVYFDKVLGESYEASVNVYVTPYDRADTGFVTLDGGSEENSYSFLIIDALLVAGYEEDFNPDIFFYCGAGNAQSYDSLSEFGNEGESCAYDIMATVGSDDVVVETYQIAEYSSGEPRDGLGSHQYAYTAVGDFSSTYFYNAAGLEKPLAVEIRISDSRAWGAKRSSVKITAGSIERTYFYDGISFNEERQQYVPTRWLASQSEDGDAELVCIDYR